jgi:hypothetical protein
MPILRYAQIDKPLCESVFFGEHFENFVKLRQGFFAGGHEGVAAGDGGDLRDPGSVFLAVQDGFVFAQSHEIISRLKANIAPEKRITEVWLARAIA